MSGRKLGGREAGKQGSWEAGMPGGYKAGMLESQDAGKQGSQEAGMLESPTNLIYFSRLSAYPAILQPSSLIASKLASLYAT
jgi:hypothetical protein